MMSEAMRAETDASRIIAGLSEATEIATLNRDLKDELARAGLATWGGRGTLTSVAAALHAKGWRMKDAG